MLEICIDGVDSKRCEKLIAAAGDMDITFHRACDMSRDLHEAMEDIIKLGIRRILTSGGMPDVPIGIPRTRASRSS